MKIVMIGTGYVGLVTGTCFANSGNDVTCLDIDESKIEGLKNGKIPIYEPGLTEMVISNHKAGRLNFTTNYDECIPNADCIFIAVGTPQSDDGSANLNGLWAVVDTIAPRLNEKTVVIIKSTVPVGTNRKMLDRLTKLTGRDNIKVASNPEFLKEGAAIDDFTKPDRVVVGVNEPEAAEKLEELYKPFLRTEQPFLSMGLESAEMTKYVANCMLATKISFINEMANLCDLVSADINEVRRGIGHDQRIGFQFLFPGVGYGGSCFPKDVRALISVAADNGMKAEILQSVDDVNDAQKEVLFNKIKSQLGDLKGKQIAIWGLSFKPRTDDIREAPSLVLIKQLLSEGAIVRAHDPVSIENVKAELGDQIEYCAHHYDTLENADALAIVTEWSEYRNPDFEFLKHKMKQMNIFDGRNLYDPKKMTDLGFTYQGIGLKGDQ